MRKNVSEPALESIGHLLLNLVKFLRGEVSDLVVVAPNIVSGAGDGVGIADNIVARTPDGIGLAPPHIAGPFHHVAPSIYNPLSNCQHYYY